MWQRASRMTDSSGRSRAENQEASVSCLKRRSPRLRRCSITAVVSPVSIALELATERSIRALAIVTRVALVLRTIETLQWAKCSGIIALALGSVLLHNQPHFVTNSGR